MKGSCQNKKNPQRPVSAGADSSSARGKRTLLHARAAPAAFRNHGFIRSTSWNQRFLQESNASLLFLIAEPFRVDLVVLAAILEFLERGVDLLRELLVVLRDGDAVVLRRQTLRQGLDARLPALPDQKNLR